MVSRSVEYVFKGNFTNLAAGLTAAGRATADLGNKLTGLDKNGYKLRAGLTQVGDTAGKLGLAASAGLALVTKAAMDWESAWAGVSKTVNGSTAELAALEGQLREMARTMPATHEEIAAVAQAAGALGVATPNVASFTKTMIMLGEATDDLTADEAATAIAQMTNVMRTAPEDVDNLAAALVYLGNNGASTEGQIVRMAQRISGAGAQIGLTEADVLGIANAAASMGLEVEAGGTAVSRVFSELARATSSGGPKLAEFARIAGLSADEFGRMFKETPAEAFAAFTQGLDRVNKSGGDVFSTLKAVGLSDVRVSDALLRMAGAGDVLTDSLAGSREAWGENTALQNEYARRAETTAAQVQVAWNNIKDAAIEFGAVALPVVAKAADVTASFAQTIGALPGPVKSVGTALLAVTAVLGGGLWFTAKTVNAVTNMNRALGDLGISGRRGAQGADMASRSMGRLAGRAVGILAVGTAVGALADNIGRIDPKNLDRSLAALGRGEVTGEVEKIIDDLKSITDWTNKIDLGEIVTLGGLFGDSTRDRWKSNIDQMDQSLANLVETGDQAQAKLLLDQIVDRAGLSAKETAEYFDAYGLALQNAASETDGSTSSTLGLTASQRDLAAATGRSEEEIQGLIEAMREQRSEAIRAENAELNYKASLLDAQDALKENGATLDENTRAGQANHRALLDMAAAWNDQDATIKNGRGARKAAIDEFVRIAGQMGMNKKAAREYADTLFEIPEKRVTKVDAETGEAKSKLAGVSSLLDSLVRTPWNINVKVNVPKSIAAPSVTYPGGSKPKIPLTKATGGLVTGPGGPTDDAIPAWLSNREYVMPAAAVAKYGVPFFDALRAERLAKGGQPGKGKTISASSPFFTTFDASMLGLDRLPTSLKAWDRALDASTKAVDRERSARDDLVAKRDQLASSISDKLRQGFFDSASSDVWLSGEQRSASAVSSLFSSLSGSIANADAWSAAQKALTAKGVSGGALEALLSQARGPQDLAAIAGMSQADITRYMQLYAQSTSKVTATSAGSANAVWGQSIQIANQQYQATLAQNKLLAQQNAALIKAVKDSNDKSTRELVKALGGVVPKGKR